MRIVTTLSPAAQLSLLYEVLYEFETNPQAEFMCNEIREVLKRFDLEAAPEFEEAETKLFPTLQALKPKDKAEGVPWFNKSELLATKRHRIALLNKAIETLKKS